MNFDLKEVQIKQNRRFKTFAMATLWEMALWTMLGSTVSWIIMLVALLLTVPFPLFATGLMSYYGLWINLVVRFYDVPFCDAPLKKVGNDRWPIFDRRPIFEREDDPWVILGISVEFMLTALLGFALGGKLGFVFGFLVIYLLLDVLSRPNGRIRGFVWAVLVGVLGGILGLSVRTVLVSTLGEDEMWIHLAAIALIALMFVVRCVVLPKRQKDQASFRQ